MAPGKVNGEMLAEKGNKNTTIYFNLAGGNGMKNKKEGWFRKKAEASQQSGERICNKNVIIFQKGVAICKRLCYNTNNLHKTKE